MIRAINEPCDPTQEYLLIGDLHLDNPKADLDRFHHTMKEAVNRNAKVIIAGDTFCAMQGKYDPRASKDDLRPEHWGGNYFDKLVSWMVEQFQPYANNILLMSYGNHETSVLKRNETDLLDRLVTILNHSTKSSINIGSYACWVNFLIHKKNGSKTSQKMYIHHGWGGGGVVTRGVIHNQRLDAMISNADITLMGHVHERYVMQSVKEELYFCSHNGVTVRSKPVYHVRVSTLKDEHSQGNGYHTEKGRPHKPLGGYFMRFDVSRRRINGISHNHVQPQFEMT